jgi:hypothetical protein
MPLKFIGAVHKKRGSIDRGVLEVSCGIEIEFDDSCSNDADDIQRRVERAYAACRQAVEAELGRNVEAGVQLAADRSRTTGSPANRQPGRCNGLGASQKRIDYSE